MMPALDNITWERVEREYAVTYPTDGPDMPGRDVVFDNGFPRPGGFAKLVATKLQPPDEVPDAEYPFILSTGRQLEHWHTGSMTRRATVLDALEPTASAQLSRGTIAKLGIQPGDMVRVTTRRGTVELAARQDDAVPDGVVFIPFAYVEAAANLLTNPEARSVRQDSRVQVLRRQGRGGRSDVAGRGGVGRRCYLKAVRFLAAGSQPSLPLVGRVARFSAPGGVDAPQLRPHPASLGYRLRSATLPTRGRETAVPH